MSVNQCRDNCSAGAERDGGKPANLFLSERMKRGVDKTLANGADCGVKRDAPPHRPTDSAAGEREAAPNSVRCSR